MGDRQSAFEIAKAKRVQQKAEEDSKKDWGGYEEIKYAPLVHDVYKSFRLLGLPEAMREKPSDPKMIEQSMILADDGKKFRCTWPTKDKDPDWILRRIYNLVLTGKWKEKKDDEKAEKIFTHKTTHPEIFKRVKFNNNLEIGRAHV